MSAIRNLLTRPWVVMPLLAVVGLGAWWVVAHDTRSASAVSTGDQVVAATVGTMARTVTADGTVAVAESQDLSFTSAGTVTGVDVSAGQAVTAGEVLATIDSAALQAGVADAQSSVASAQAKLSDDTSAGASSAQLAADASALTSAQDKLAAAQSALAGAQLVATIDGTVASVNLTVGQQLGSSGGGGTAVTGTGSGSGATAATIGSSGSAGSSGRTGTGSTGGSSAASSTSTPQIRVVSSNSFTVPLSLDATQVADVKVGQSATVTLVTSTSSGTGRQFGGGFGGAFPGQGGGQGGQTAGQSGTTGSGQSSTRQIAGTAAATGTVTDVGQVADASSGVAKYKVTVSFTDTSGSYNAGANVNVAITYAQVDGALQVPQRAVTTANGASTVTVASGGSTETRTVTTGLTANGMVQVTSGLSEGEQVVITLPTGLGGQRGTQTGQGGQTGQTGQGGQTRQSGAQSTGGNRG